MRLWSVATGQELCALKDHAERVGSVAFSPEGWRLASGGGDGMKVWDATKLTTVLRDQREALGLVEFLFARSDSEQEVRERLHADPTITEAVRQHAEALMQEHAEHLLVQQATRQVTSLYDGKLLKEEKLARIQSDSRISEAVRQRALALLERSSEDPFALDHASWKVVKRADATPEEYNTALCQAQRACRLTDHQGFLGTLGVAQYRVGHYQHAVETLTCCERMTARDAGGSVPADLAFLAMAHARLGQADQARVFLARLRESRNSPRWSKDEDQLNQSFLREAEALIERKPPQTRRFDH